jgi:hypothetical protein
MVNKASSYMQEISTKADLYHMQPMFEKIFEKFQMFCDVLHEYNINLLSNSTNEKDLNTHFITLQLGFTTFVEKPYKKAKKLLKEREELEPKNLGQKLWASKWSFLQYIWKTKYNLYFFGVLAYNVYTYVYLPGELKEYMNILLRVAGTICFTFTDPIIAGKILKSFIGGIASVSKELLKFIPFFTTTTELLKKLPLPLQSAYEGTEAFFSYIFIHFTLDFTKYLISVICKCILITGAVYEGGTTAVTKGIWVEILKSRDVIANSIDKAYIFVTYSMSVFGISLGKGLSVIFLDVIGQCILQPIITYIKNIPSKMYGNFFTSSDLTTSTDTAQSIIESNPQLSNIVEYFSNNPETSMILAETQQQFKNVLVGALSNIKVDVNKEFYNFQENTGERILTNLETIMKKQKTFDLYNNYSNLLNINTTYVVCLFIIIALFSSFINNLSLYLL